MTAVVSAGVRADVLAWGLRDAAAAHDLAVLSADERARADRFRFERDRGRYVSGRATLRRILAERLGCAPADVELAYGAAGKPHLPGVPLEFNVSHSESVALLVVAEGVRAVGVDVELPRPGFGGEQIARQFFAPGEVRRLLALPPADRDDAFLRCWTRKEALLKAHGGGLTLPLHDFEVSLEPGVPAAILEPGPTLGAGDWQLYDVSACWPGVHAAVAVDSTTPVTLTFTVPEGGTS